MPTPSPSPQQCKQSVSEKSHIFDSFLFAMMPASICYLFGLVWCVDTLFFVHVLLFANDMCTAHNVQNYERFVVTQLTDINPLNCCDGIQKFFSLHTVGMHVVLIWAANFSWKIEHPAKGISNKIDLNSFFFLHVPTWECYLCNVIMDVQMLPVAFIICFFLSFISQSFCFSKKNGLS